MIKTIIFDNNGVMAYGDSERTIPALAEYFGVNGAYLDSFFHEEAKAFDDGSIGANVFYKRIADRLQKPYNFNELKEINISSYAPRPGMQDLVKKLNASYQVALLTNLGDVYDEANRRLWHYDKLFGRDNIFVSCKLKMKKPEKEIYEYALKALGAKPSETVFIDDRESNLAPARELGMKTILFTSPKQCKNELSLLLEEQDV